MLDGPADKFQIGDDVQATPIGVRDVFAYGVLLEKPTTFEPGELVISFNELSAARGTFRSTEIQVIARTAQGYYVDTEGCDASLGGAALGDYALGSGPSVTSRSFQTR